LSRPLDNIRVLDFGQYLAGPLVGMILADLGAEVIRIDPPEGPRFRDPAHDIFSRGKSAVTIDLKSEEGPKIALALTARADAVIENFRPGVMDRLGLGFDALHKVNPNIILLSLPGFASTDPALAEVPAWEAVIAARTGQFTDMGLNRRLMGVNPSFTPLALASAYASVFGAMSVQFALLNRHKNGGDHIEVPLASALFEGLAYNCEQIEDYPARYKSPREIELERRASSGSSNNMGFSELEEFLDPFYRTYTCADGRGFYVVAGSIVSHPRRVLKTLGLESLIDELPDFDAYLDTSDWPDQWSLRNYPVGERDRTRIAVKMKDAFLKKSSDEWEQLFGDAKAPGIAQRTSKDWMNDEHALASGLILEVEHPRYGRMKQMGNVAWLKDDHEALTKLPPPSSDSAPLHEILRESPRDSEPISADDGWLEGLKVLDLTNVIAGPTIGSTLARFGAKVTLVQPVTPTLDPWNAVVFGIHAHRGKRSILLDIRKPAGEAALHKLIAKSDVITINATDAQLESLGLTEGKLAEMNPRLILVQLDAFGGASQGPKSNYLGYDDLAQAATGVMLRFGGSMSTPEEHAHFGTIDVLTGYCACVALGAALIRLSRTGKGGIARASLAGAGNLIQAQLMYDFEGRPPFDEPAGREARGWGPFYHCYPAADCWIFFAAPRERREALRRVPDLADLSEVPEEDLTQALGSRFEQQPGTFWQSAFAGTSSTVMPLGSLHQTRDESCVDENSGKIDLKHQTFRVIRHDEHPMGRWCDLVAPNAVRPRKARIQIPDPMPKYGAHTREILHELGYRADQVDDLIACQIASEGWSENYLPE